MEANIAFFIRHGPQKGFYYPPDTMQSTFSGNNNYQKAILLKINFFQA